MIEASAESPVNLGWDVRIGHHVTLRGPLTLGDGVEIRDYGHVGAGSILGDESKLLYGGAVYQNVSIGKHCIVSGSVDTGTVIGDDVSFLGRILHNYRTPGTFTELTDGIPSPSPRIHDRAVVGEGSLVVGDIDIGAGAYVAAGMVVKCDVPPENLYCEKGLIPLSEFRGFISGRVENLE
ncbi:acyltransferase [Micromonospora sp. NPDC000316]|uniref:acyltransferase n=1 Tax=Micromonospora sp. NPDC000316 TaxID=3364216 RepID=UPI0036B62140